MLEPGACDAVHVAVPHDAQEEIALLCAAASLPVLLEKPVAATVEAGVRIVATLRRGARIAVNYQYGYDPRAWAIVQAARAGALGSLRYAVVEVPWHRDAGYFAAAPWHASRTRSGGGALLTQGSHLLDLALLGCGAPARARGRTYRRVHTAPEVEDLAVGVVKTVAGVPVHVISSMVSVPPGEAVLRLVGERGTLEWRGPARSRIRARRIRIRAPFVWTQLHVYVTSLGAFARWADGGPAPRCDAEDALVVLRAVDALYRSAESDAVVEIDHG